MTIYEDAAHGGSGVDTISFAPTVDPADAVTVDLSQESGQVQTVNGNLKLALYGQIENLIGSSGNDHLFGNSAANVITGGPGNDVLSGNGGSDRYVFAGGWGMDTITDLSGTATLDFSAATAPLDFNLAPSGITVTGGGNSLSTGANVVRNLIGGSGDDTFAFQNGVTLGGTLDGGAGSNTLDFSAYTTGLTIHLTGIGTTTGFQGNVPGPRAPALTISPPY